MAWVIGFVYGAGALRIHGLRLQGIKGDTGVCVLSSCSLQGRGGLVIVFGGVGFWLWWTARAVFTRSI